MATVKIKFRPSSVPNEQGILFYQIIHQRIARQQKTGYRLYAQEWNAHTAKVVLPTNNEERQGYLLTIIEHIQVDLSVFHKIICRFDRDNKEYTADQVIAAFLVERPRIYLFSFMEGVITHLQSINRVRTSENYATTLSSFRRFRANKDLPLEAIHGEVMMAYENYLQQQGLTPNTTSFYMRNLRAVYNRAVEQGLIPQRFPFKHVYTGVEKTIKRAIPLKVIKQIKGLDFPSNPTFSFARDMFLFSFYTRGMSFVDMAYLRKSDLRHRVLSYRRRKTGQRLIIKWEQCMQEIVKKYDTTGSEYLLPIIKPQNHLDERKQYLYAAHKINRCLKIIGRQLGLTIPLTLYVARHAWASIAKSKQVPLSVISDGLGHDSERTTRIYLASLDTTAIDRANHIILKSL